MFDSENVNSSEKFHGFTVAIKTEKRRLRFIDFMSISLFYYINLWVLSNKIVTINIIYIYMFK